jgi:hypothetical protein
MMEREKNINMNQNTNDLRLYVIKLKGHHRLGRERKKHQYEPEYQ